MKKILKWGGIGFVVLVILGAIGSANTKNRSTSASPTPTAQVQASPSPQPDQFVFDVPALLTMNIDQVRETLGKPVDKDIEPSSQQLKLGATEWYNEFDKDGRQLTVTYDPKTRATKDFFISASDAESSKADKQSLLGVGHLKENDANYSVDFVKVINDPKKITGVKIMAK
jgi:hypothetical protein